MTLPPLTYLILLAVLCLVPLALLGMLVLLPRKVAAVDKMVSGNAMLERHDSMARPEVFLQPLARTVNQCSDAELRHLMLGLRHLPLQHTAPLLKHGMRRRDPEVHIYSQSILQEKQEALQNAFTRAAAKASAADETSQANFLEAGLNLILSPLTQASEVPSLLVKLRPALQTALTTNANHPRLLAAGIELCLLSKNPQEAEKLLARLPVGSPLHEQHEHSVRHHLAIHQPPEPAPASASARYQIS